jgi:hypothetical protein
VIGPRGPPCFLLTGDQWEMCLMGLHFYLGNSQSVCYTISVVEKVSKTLRTFPKLCCQNTSGTAQMVSQSRLDPFLIASRHRFGDFLYISLEAACFCLGRLKIEDAS